MLEQILFHSPWVPYNDKFIQSRITLTYPENVIFAAQCLKHVTHLQVYKKFPYAEKIDISEFAKVDWTKAIVVFDKDLQLLFAPDPVYKLVRLERRLGYREGFDAVFAPFRFLPFFKVYQCLGVFLIFFVYGCLTWLIARRYRDYSVVLSSKPSTDSTDPRP